MSAVATRHPAIGHFIRGIESIASISFADRSWDNVGLLFESPRVKLIGPNNSCRVLLTIDLTEAVFREAVEKEASIILSYHPPWFRNEKSLTLDSSRGMTRMVTLCASEGISIYSPHSALDAIKGGINDHVVSILSNGDFVESSPIVKLPPPNDNCGSGRIFTLSKPTSIRDCLKRWCQYIGIPHIRIALPEGSTLEKVIKTIAVCVGSGGSVLNGIKADMYFTGEMSHHEILLANVAHSATVVLTEHTNCERGFLKDQLEPLLRKSLESSKVPFEVITSNVDRDPISIISFDN